MKIAICDNDKTIIDKLMLFINKYKNCKNKKIECYHFYSGEDLLRSSEHFDVIFLDI